MLAQVRGAILRRQGARDLGVHSRGTTGLAATEPGPHEAQTGYAEVRRVPEDVLGRGTFEPSPLPEAQTAWNGTWKDQIIEN